MESFSCDFETTTDPYDCRVWSWGAYSLKREEYNKGIDIQSFIEWASSYDKRIYFHNLKFDGEFIVSYLLSHNIKWVDRNKYYTNVFTTLIDDMGSWYCLDIWFENCHVKIIDSLKTLPMPVSKLSKAFGLEESKSIIDYKKVS